MGLAAARLLAKGGAQVVIASRSREKLERAKSEINGDVETAVLDIRYDQQVTSFFEKLGAIDHLVISSAGAVVAPFMELDIARAKDFFDSKFWGAYRVARAAAPNIRYAGSITFFSGAASQRGTPGLS